MIRERPHGLRRQSESSSSLGPSHMRQLSLLGVVQKGSGDPLDITYYLVG